MNMRESLLTGAMLALVVTVWAPPEAHAQAADSPPVEIKIDAPLLSSALIQLTQQTGLQLIFPAADHASELPAPALSGNYTPAAALDHLLKGSGLRYEFIDSHTVAIRSSNTS